MRKEYKKLMLSSGVRLYVLPMHWAKMIGLGIYVNVGTRDEIWPKQAGLAHAFEHMVFQRTEEFPDSKAISEPIEQIGGVANAFTGNEMSCFYTLIPSEEKEKGFKFLSQILRKPVFTSANIKTEMKNILHEISRANDDPTHFLDDKLLETIFGKHPLGKRVLGLKESVLKFKVKDFQDWQKNFYHPANFTFLVVGDITLKQAKAYFEEYFPEKVRKSANFRNPESVLAKPSEKIIKKNCEQAHKIMGALSPAAGTRESLVLGVFLTMIDGGMSFPLFQEVRDKRGLCYQINAYQDLWSDAGTFAVYIGTELEKVKEATDSIFRVITESKRSKDLLEKAKRCIKGRRALRYSISSLLNEGLSDITQYKEPRGYEEVLKVVQSVTIEEVEKVVNRYLSPEKFSKVILAPSK